MKIADTKLTTTYGGTTGQVKLYLQQLACAEPHFQANIIVNGKRKARLNFHSFEDANDFMKIVSKGWFSR